MKSLLVPLSRRASIASLVGLLCLCVVPLIQAAYSFKNVQIQGGGFVPGIIFNQTQANLIYARTDIGGAYRWDQSTSTWIPLNDAVGSSNWGSLGCVSIASDPVEPNKVYIAAGMYTNGWDPNNGVIMRSTDKGATWATTSLPFTLGGNMPGRGMCERLVIDPNKNSILFLAAPSGNGLWKSTDSGVTWAQVTSFPNPGNYVETPGDVYGGITPGVTWVVFDPRTGSSGNPTQTIYVGVADLQASLYRSTDGGATWALVPGEPTGLMAHHAVLDPVNGLLYLTYNNNAGPYDGTLGDVWKLATTSGVWTRISPVPSTDTSNDYFGYGGLAIDRQHPSTIMVSALNSWWPDGIIWRSVDGGATWSKIWNWTSYPSYTTRYVMDITSCPWLKLPAKPIARGGRPGPVLPNPGVGWMIESLEIDPFNSDRIMWGTGETIYSSTNLTVWDGSTTSQITLKPGAKGIEETAVLDLISPPSGAPLLSALGDIGGFVHNDVTVVPTTCWTPIAGTNRSIDFAELVPTYVARVGDGDNANGEYDFALSTNGGSTWTGALVQPAGVTGGGTVAVSATGAGKIVWSPSGAGVYYTTAGGTTKTAWKASTGVPAGALVRSDRANGNKFYAFLNGTFYVSTNGGQSFSTTAAAGLPAYGTFRAVMGREGDIWFAGNGTVNGLWHSTNSGVSFTKLTNVDQAVAVGFGKAATGQTYPAIYLSGQVAGVPGVFRSDDAGVTWVRINDDQHQYGALPTVITGDPRIYGRFYIGTNGRGIVYGDIVP
jgi:photosystem II stability/assembly factor-like uncharacterized protein